MKTQMRKICLPAGWLILLAGLATAEPVDPRFPSERIFPSPPERSRWLPTRIEQLTAERDELLAKIAALPQHNPRIRTDYLGFHSLFKRPDSDQALPSDQISIKFPHNPPLHSIAFAPAFNPEKPGAYAFPKRFKIELQYTTEGEYETAVDWMEDDFPDPGLYPVYFAGIDRRVKQVRITIPQVPRESGVAYYAIGEIYLFQQNPDGSIGANAVTWGREHVKISSSDSLTLPPLWDPSFLYDGIDGFGLPLSNESVKSQDLLISSEADKPISEKVRITMDLGIVRRIGRIDIWPAEAPYHMALPSFGFPRKITLELSPDPDFKTVWTLQPENQADLARRGNLLTIAVAGYNARYIRITAEDFDTYQGRHILGLGEISVSCSGNIWSSGCKIDASGIPDECREQLPRLVDGCSRGHRIIPQGVWLKGLAKRRPLDLRLSQVETELERALKSWKRIRKAAGIGTGAVIAIGMLGILAVQWRIRKRAIERTRWSIARDLHDDVGSSLGSISLLAEQLKNAKVDQEAREDLCALSLMAREAWASLRDIIWIVDQARITLPALVQKLVERARRVLGGVEVLADVSEDLPDCIVTLTCKRHLISFFKEVLHNCARHAQASRMWMVFSANEDRLHISVRDNGRGFDPGEASAGLGLDSMRKRVEEMGGEMELDSSPGQGVSLAVWIPLSALGDKNKPTYRTSN